MSEPIVAARKPMVLQLEPGTYFWCACGRSANQPFCDGSHRGTGLEPVKFEVGEPRSAAICVCKRTADGPYCDGSHAKL